MAQHFIISTDSSPSDNVPPTAKERNKITRMLQAKGWDVWHWFDDLWLVVNSGKDYSPADLREDIQNLFSADKNVIVIQVEGVSYSGFGPPRAWTWMRKKWPGDSV